MVCTAGQGCINEKYWRRMKQAYGGGCIQMSIKDGGKNLRMTRISRPWLRTLVIACVPLLTLTACTMASHGDLVEYVQKVKAKKGDRIPPLPDVKVYTAYEYDKADLRDPFNAAMDEALVEAASDGPEPDMERHKEPLESFPLDTLRFVGHLEQHGRVWAVITAPDALVYRVEEGNYLGQSYGRIVRITESQLDIREIVPNGMGGWVERDAVLTLAE